MASAGLHPSMGPPCHGVRRSGSLEGRAIRSCLQFDQQGVARSIRRPRFHMDGVDDQPPGFPISLEVGARDDPVSKSPIQKLLSNTSML